MAPAANGDRLPSQARSSDGNGDSRTHLAARSSQNDREMSGALLEGAFYLAVGLVLAEGIDGPDRGGNPADQCHLQQETEEASHRAADGEKGEPR